MLQDHKPRLQESPDIVSVANNMPGHVPDSSALGASRVGAELRVARQRLGWSLPDVAATLRIRLPFLEAIEEGRLADLPGNAYAVGFLRSYSTFLGLDASEVARRFRAEAQEVNRTPDLSFPAPVPDRGVPAGAVVLLGVLIAVGAYGAWYKFSGDTPSPVAAVPAVPDRLAPLADRAALPSNPSPQVATVLAAPANPPDSSSALSASSSPAMPVTTGPVAASADISRMVLRMKADTWIQVREKQGPVLLNRLMRTGESWSVPKGQHLLLTTGNAGGTELMLDGMATASLGGLGAVRRDIPLEFDIAKAADPARAIASAPVASKPATQ